MVRGGLVLVLAYPVTVCVMTVEYASTGRLFRYSNEYGLLVTSTDPMIDLHRTLNAHAIRPVVTAMMLSSASSKKAKLDELLRGKDMRMVGRVQL
jgi:hypothetical protein